MSDDADQRRPRWLTRNLAVLSGVSLLQDAASELVYPVLPVFITVTLGAPAVAVGLVEGLAEGVSSITKVVAGRFSDRFRRRPLIAVGYGLAAVGKGVVAVATLWPVVLVGRAVDRVGKGVRGAPRDALLVTDIPVSARGRALGFHRSADTAGAVLGPGIGLAVYELVNHSVRPLLILAVLPAVASVLLVAAVREHPEQARTAAAALRNPVRWGELPARFWRVAAVLALFSLVNFPDALVLLRLHDIGFSLGPLMGAYMTYNAVYALLSYPAGALSDRLPRGRVFGVGLLFFAIAYLGLGATHSEPVAWLLLTAYGAYTALTDGVGKAWISTLVPNRVQGSAQGAFQGMTGAGVLVAGTWAGLAWGDAGQLPLLVAGAVGALFALLLVAAPGRLSATPAA